jgi:hypothetical protein
LPVRQQLTQVGHLSDRLLLLTINIRLDSKSTLDYLCRPSEAKKKVFQLFPQVDNVDDVSRLQDQYLIMLHRYLKYKYQWEANSKLAKGIMISSLAREAQEIRRQRLPV